MATNIPGDINQTRQRNTVPVAKKQTSFDITNTPGLKQAGPPPVGNIASPGYSSFSPVRDIQSANDRRSQSNAVAADGVVQKVDRLTQGAVDKTMQQGAVATATPAQPTPVSADAEMQRHVTSVTGKRQGDTMTPQDLQALGLNTAAGLMVRDNLTEMPGAGNDPVRAARMQAAYDQPATHGEGAPIQPIAAGVQQQEPGAFDKLAQSAGQGSVAALADQGLMAIRDPQQGQRMRAARGLGGETPLADVATQSANANAIQRTRNRGSVDSLASPQQQAVTAVGATGSPASSAPYNNASEQTVDPLVAGIQRGGDGGKTSFSVQGGKGDARTALEIGDAKNAQLRQMVSLQRDHELGSGRGNVGQVSSTAIEQAARKAKITGSATDRADYDRLVKLDAGQAADRIEQNGKQKPGWKTDAEKAAAQAITAKAETEQQLNAATSQQQAARARNVAALEAAIVDPNATPEERAIARNNYDVLTTPVKDRYLTVAGGTNEFGAKDSSKVFDATAGQMVGEGGAQQQAAPPGMTHTGYTPQGKKVYTDANGKMHAES